jgi:hypothetical protein
MSREGDSPEKQEIARLSYGKAVANRRRQNHWGQNHEMEAHEVQPGGAATKISITNRSRTEPFGARAMRLT